MIKGQQLNKFEFLASKNRKFRLLMHSNGNLYLSFNNPDWIVWSVETRRKYGDRLVMERNGNLVVYGSFGNKQVAWEAGTSGRGESLVLEDNANLVVYDAKKNKAWSTGLTQSMVK